MGAIRYLFIAFYTFTAVLAAAQNIVLSEDFDECTLPAGWENTILTGQQGWHVGLLDSSSAVFADGNSMNGTCFAYFDDDALGSGAPFSTVRLATPWFNGGQYAAFELQFDVVFPLNGDQLQVLVEHGDGAVFTVRTYAWRVGGPPFNQYQNRTLDLTPFRHPQMRVVFEYSDGNGTGWWAGLDNITVSGNGILNDVCANASPLYTAAACTETSNTVALFDGPPADCAAKPVAGLWYRWVADFSGLARLRTKASFNDIVTVFSGDCLNLQTLLCHNKDEHGFNGETVYFQAETGVEYFFRVNGEDGGFGAPRGTLCVDIMPMPAAPLPPSNDDCSNATELALLAPCTTSGANRNATTSSTLPSLNLLARADVWYRFTAPAAVPGQKLALRSNADFSDIITLYRGACDQLEEVAGNHLGALLILPADLVEGETYFVQISGTFASVEGNLCPELVLLADTPPDNDDCTGAFPIPVDSFCTSGNIAGSRVSAYVPPCAVSVGADIWFRFTAPSSGGVKINTGTQFEHFLAIWRGACDSLMPVFCTENPQRCAGYLDVEGLIGGETYYLQIASRTAQAPYFGSGALCITLLDQQTAGVFKPLQIEVEEECNSPQTGVIAIDVQGGIPPYTMLSAQSGQEFMSGASYVVSVRDAAGCEQSLTNTMRTCIDAGCFLQAVLTDVQPKCHNAADGALTVQTLLGTAPYTFQWSNGSTESALYNIPAGTYVVTVTDVVGCEATATQTLVNPDAIQIGVTEIIQPNTGLNNGFIQLSVAGGTGGLSLAWQRDGTPLSDSTAMLAGLAGGLYTLMVTDANGCTAVFDTLLTETVRTQSPGQAVVAGLYPNPAASTMTLTLNLSTPQELALRITDASGRTLRSWSAGRMLQGTVAIPVQALAQGNYQLHIVAGEEVLVRSFSVKR